MIKSIFIFLLSMITTYTIATSPFSMDTYGILDIFSDVIDDISYTIEDSIDNIRDWIDSYRISYTDNDYGLVEVRYSQGGSDMNGEYHNTTLCLDERGNWIIECRDREDLETPTVITTYSVHPDGVHHFEEFLKEADVVSLSRRSESDEYVLDYSPWSYEIVFKDYSQEKPNRTSYRFNEYQNYSARDKKLIEELQQQLLGLKGSKISEVVGMDE